MILPWRSRGKAESVCQPAFIGEPYYGGRCGVTEMVRVVAVPRVVEVEGGWLALGCYLEHTRKTELIDRHRKVHWVVMPGDWPENNLAKTG
jgi:hypothetical protein